MKTGWTLMDSFQSSLSISCSPFKLWEKLHVRKSRFCKFLRLPFIPLNHSSYFLQVLLCLSIHYVTSLIISIFFHSQWKWNAASLMDLKTVPKILISRTIDRLLNPFLNFISVNKQNVVRDQSFPPYFSFSYVVKMTALLIWPKFDG